MRIRLCICQFQYQPLVEKLYEVQRKQATELLAEAKQKITEGGKTKNQQMLEEGFLSLYRSYKALPKNKPLIKYLSEEGIKAGLLKTEEFYMANNNREMPKAVEPLYFVVDEKLNSADLTDKGTEWLAKQVNDRELFVLPDITTQMYCGQQPWSLHSSTSEHRYADRDSPGDS